MTADPVRNPPNPSEESSLSRVARAWATLDLAVTSLLVVPWTAERIIRLVHTLSGQAMPSFRPTQLFFVSLAGALGVIWAVARLQLPHRELIRIDVIGRIVVGAMIIAFVGALGASKALLAFVATEFIGAGHQAIALQRAAAVDQERGRAPRT